MGKSDNQRLPVVQQLTHGSAATTSLLYRRCLVNFFNFNCVVVLVLSVAAFLPAIFWVFPNRHGESGFDADESMKLSATVQSYFKLQRPAPELVPYIKRLEYDINEEIGVPFFKVAVLSMHQAGVFNWTNVVFGFHSNVSNPPKSAVLLSVLKSSLVDLFLLQYNMTLTSIFGETSSFEILKFPGGISVLLGQDAMLLHMPQVLFNFTLNSSICEIRENILELKEQLRIGLQLVPTEVVFIQATNKHGSTKDPPVTIEASVVSDIGTLQPERLKQLAQRITESPSIENLGLDHSVFGKVEEVSLSSFLNHSLYAPTPTPTPTPSPSPVPSTEQIYNTSPLLAPSHSPVLLPGPNCSSSAPSDARPVPAPSSNNAPCDSLSTPNSLTPSVDPSSLSPYSPCTPTSHPNQLFPSLSPHTYSELPLPTHESYFSPSVSPLPSDYYATRGLDKWRVESLLSSTHFTSSFASSMSSGMWRSIWRFFLTGVLILVLALRIS